MVKMTAENNPIASRFSSVSEIQNTLSRLMPVLQDYWTRPLRDYAATAYRSQIIGDPVGMRLDAMQRLQACVERAALRAGYDLEHAADAVAQLATTPVLQTGPHCHLLVEPDAFYTQLFALMGLSAHKLRWNIWYGASTVKLIESAKKGPGWLRLQGSVVNVFGLPRKQMDAYSLCGLPKRSLYFRLSSAGDEGPVNASARALLQLLPTAEFASAALAIKAANHVLWQRFAPETIGLVQLDDFDAADLLVDHLSEDTSWLSRHLFGEDGWAIAAMEALRELNEGPWSGWIAQTSDLFWRQSDGRLYPLRLRGSCLSDGRDPAFSVSFERVAIAAALRDRHLVPGLLMTFLLLSILPGVRVLGGCRQVVYYPLMRYVAARAFHAQRERKVLAGLRNDEVPSFLGASCFVRSWHGLSFSQHREAAGNSRCWRKVWWDRLSAVGPKRSWNRLTLRPA
jgi:hypothetical protein